MTNLVKTIKVLFLAGVVLTATSCEDFMSTESNRYMEVEDNLINSPNDTVYSILGILYQVQQIADKYVLMGELRGDLLDVTSKTKADVRSLNNHSVDPATSDFTDTSDFYAIINNCNYFISRADTSVSVRGLKSFVREVHAAKTIRAWTYLQLGLNYGKVRYFSDPILSVDDLNKNLPELSVEQLVDTLIAELHTLNPLVNVEIPLYGSINDVATRYLFINTRFLMGDLYLWRGGMKQDVADYENAARYYSRLILDGELELRDFSVSWINDTYKSTFDTWSSIFLNSTSSFEVISLIKLTNSTYNGTRSELNIMSENQELTISSAYQALSDQQMYALRESSGTVKYTTGDLRIKGALVNNNIDINNTPDPTAIPVQVIRKFRQNNIMIYRRALLYLRYAEAVNRAGKPSLAFAVLKYGLKATVLSNPAFVSPGDIVNAEPYVTVFNNPLFNSNSAVHSRGSGNSPFNAFYIIPDYTRTETYNDILGNDSVGKATSPLILAQAEADSILFVENAICDELALETAMEGNRFHDLMRLSIHRNDPAFLADKVAKKHTTNYSQYFNLLSNKQNWYLPMRN